MPAADTRRLHAHRPGCSRTLQQRVGAKRRQRLARGEVTQSAGKATGQPCGVVERRPVDPCSGTLREEAIKDGIDAADFDAIVRPENMISPG